MITSSIRRRLAAAGVAVSLLVAPVLTAGGASATPIFIGWSDDLPAWAYQYTPSSEDECAAGRPSCVRTTIRKMTRQFNRFAEACDHKAVFALAYLRTTEAYERVAAEPGFLQDPRFVNHEDAVFGQFYFDSLADWEAGRRQKVPAAWRIAFRAAEDRAVAGSGDLLLGMNGHVNRDLPYVLAGIGLVRPDGSSRKPDHDKINVMLNDVVEPLLAEEAQRFDPTMDDVNTPYGISYTALLQLLVAWREMAWRNAERLAAAPDAAARAQVSSDIETYAATVARTITATYAYVPPVTTTRSRDAYCATHG